jgi:hypothetical protein
VIHSPGVSSLWRSDIVISAFGASGGPFDLTYIDSSSGERITKHGVVSPHQAVRIEDAAGTYFGRPGGFGTVRADLSENLVATSRTFNTSSTGTYGQFIPFARIDQGFVPLTPAGPAREMLHIERSSTFRTNAGAINAGAIDAVVRFTLFDAAGHSLDVIDRTIHPLQAIQFPIDATVADGRIEAQLLSGDAGAIAWASVIDNATGDPIFVPAQ